jgi:hypothetical protein
MVVNTITRLPIGERLLPSLVDEYANLDPEKLIASFPTSPEIIQWHEVSYRELSAAINGLAWLIEKKIGKSERFESLGYMGANDIRYTVVWLAAMKCGYCVSLLFFFVFPYGKTNLASIYFSSLFFFILVLLQALSLA